MKHQSPEELQRAAIVHSEDQLPAMSRQERLERWAELLERDPGRKLQTLPGTEYQPLATRDKMRSSGSPVSVAFEDPVFRALGLMGDSYGEARRFFELSDRELHRIVCYCHHGAMITAGSAARFVRAAVGGGGEQSGLFARVRDAFNGSV
jgi:hypothetical protein